MARPMNLPEKFNPAEGEKNYAIKKAIDMLIDAVRDDSKIYLPSVRPEPKPATWSQQQQVERDWQPLRGDPTALFWMPPVGNMVPREDVPTEVLARFGQTTEEPVDAPGE